MKFKIIVLASRGFLVSEAVDEVYICRGII